LVVGGSWLVVDEHGSRDLSRRCGDWSVAYRRAAADAPAARRPVADRAARVRGRRRDTARFGADCVHRAQATVVVSGFSRTNCSVRL